MLITRTERVVDRPNQRRLNSPEESKASESIIEMPLAVESVVISIDRDGRKQGGQKSSQHQLPPEDPEANAEGDKTKPLNVLA